MKTLLLICVCATSLAVSSASLIDALKTVHNSPAFHNLTHEDQILVIELVAETEAGELKAFVDTVGFHKVLAVIDKLPETEAHVLTNYLIKELAIEESVAATSPPAAIGRRSLAQLLSTVKANAAFKDLSDADQKLVLRVLEAAENHALTALIDQIGYSAVLRIISILPPAEEHDFEQYLIQHLQMEIKTVG